MKINVENLNKKNFEVFFGPRVVTIKDITLEEYESSSGKVMDKITFVVVDKETGQEVSLRKYLSREKTSAAEGIVSNLLRLVPEDKVETFMNAIATFTHNDTDKWSKFFNTFKGMDAVFVFGKSIKNAINEEGELVAKTYMDFTPFDFLYPINQLDAAATKFENNQDRFINTYDQRATNVAQKAKQEVANNSDDTSNGISMKEDELPF